jgi:SAM-dependent methyltransferase
MSNPPDPPGLCTEISPDDEMYTDSVEHYFGVGRLALDDIRLALSAAGRPDPETILDLPCGHGRVLRYLRAGFPSAQVTACDLNRSGVDFCAETLGATPLYSAEDPRDIPLENSFDLIWCGSLLTHLDAERWSQFLELFGSRLTPGGVMAFTTNGPHTAELLRIGTQTRDLDDPADSRPTPTEAEQRFMRLAREYFPLPQESKERMLQDYASSGFGYTDYGDIDGYGQSVSSPAWVCRTMERFGDLRLVTYIEQGWDLQDVVAYAPREHPVAAAVQ